MLWNVCNLCVDTCHVYSLLHTFLSDTCLNFLSGGRIVLFNLSWLVYNIMYIAYYFILKCYVLKVKLQQCCLYVWNARMGNYVLHRVWLCMCSSRQIISAMLVPCCCPWVFLFFLSKNLRRFLPTECASFIFIVIVCMWCDCTFALVYVRMYTQMWNCLYMYVWSFICTTVFFVAIGFRHYVALQHLNTNC